MNMMMTVIIVNVIATFGVKHCEVIASTTAERNTGKPRERR
jgi:hypothetical protein